MGTGEIAVIPFAFLNYTFPHGKGLINISHISYETLPLWQSVLFRSLEVSMVVFALLHIVLSVFFAVKFVKWIRNKDMYQKFITNPLENSAILAPFISLIITMNLFIGPIRYFIPTFAENLQLFMLPALIFWGIIWLFLMRMEIKFLKISFQKSFDY